MIWISLSFLAPRKAKAITAFRPVAKPVGTLWRSFAPPPASGSAPTPSGIRSTSQDVSLPTFLAREAQSSFRVTHHPNRTCHREGRDRRALGGFSFHHEKDTPSGSRKESRIFTLLSRSRRGKRFRNLTIFLISIHSPDRKRSEARSLCSGFCAAPAHPTSSVRGTPPKSECKFFRPRFARPMMTRNLRKNTGRSSTLTLHRSIRKLSNRDPRNPPRPGNYRTLQEVFGRRSASASIDFSALRATPRHPIEACFDQAHFRRSMIARPMIQSLSSSDRKSNSSVKCVIR